MSHETKLLGPAAIVSLVTRQVIHLNLYLGGTETGGSLSSSPNNIKTISPKVSGGDEPWDLAVRFCNHNQSCDWRSLLLKLVST